MIRGPKDYVPPVEVEVVTERSAIPLDENEGIYVRDVKTGKVCDHLSVENYVYFIINRVGLDVHWCVH